MALMTFLLMVISVGVFYYALIDIYDFYYCSDWPIANGKLINHSVDKINNHYRLKLLYSYNINNVNYKNNRITNRVYELKFKDKQKVKQFLEKWKHFGVFYNPNNPKECVLIKSKINLCHLFLFISLGCFMFFLTFLSLRYVIIFFKEQKFPIVLSKN